MKQQSFARLVIATTVALCGAGADSVWARQATGAATGPNQPVPTLEDLMRVDVPPVFGAARRLQPSTEAPSSVTVVTAADIARHGYRTLADILAGVRGFYVTYDRSYSYLGARGFSIPGDYNTRVLVLVDGHRLNDDVFDQAPIGSEFGLDPSTFERIEIIRGPASALYGTSAFFAVISITTKRGPDVGGVMVGVDAGSFGRTRTRMQYGRRLASGIEFAVGGQVEAAGGPGELYFTEYDSPDSHGGIARGLDGERSRGGVGHISFRDLTIGAGYGWRRKEVPTGAFGSLFGDDRHVTLDRRGWVDAAFERDVAGTRVSLRASADHYRYDGAYPYAPIEDGLPSVLSEDYGAGNWWSLEARATRVVVPRHTLTVGLEYRNAFDQNQGSYYEDDRLPAFATNQASTVVAAYAQDEWRVTDRLLVGLGGRFDEYAGFGQFTPRLSVIATPSPRRAFKYLLGSAFRAPNAYELDYLTNGVRNPALRAETIRTHEGVWEEYLGGRLRTTASIYLSRVEGLIALVSDADGVLHYVNTGAARAVGAEAEAEVRLGWGLVAVGSYSTQRATVPETGALLPNSPRHRAAMRLSVPGWVGGSVVAADLQAMSDRQTVSGSVVPGYRLVHVTYTHPFRGDWRLVASVRNLLNAAYAEPASEEHLQDRLPMDGRTLHVGLEWTWRR